MTPPRRPVGSLANLLAAGAALAIEAVAIVLSHGANRRARRRARGFYLEEDR